MNPPDTKISEINLPKWTCEVFAQNTKYLVPKNGERPSSQEQWVRLVEPITVGQKLKFNCHGEAANLKSDDLHIETKKESPYDLMVFSKPELTSTSVSFEAISYKIGKSRPDGVYVLSDGLRAVALNDVHFEVQSVIDPQQPPKELFPPWGPAKMQYPIWLWLASALLLVGALLVIVRGLQKRQQRKSALAALQKHRTALSPYNQFNKDIRFLNKDAGQFASEKWNNGGSQDYLNKLNEHFRWFLVRELLVPAFEWSTQNILNEIKENDVELFEVLKLPLQKALLELQRAKNRKQSLSPLDAKNLEELCRKVADTVFEYRKSQATKRNLPEVTR